MWIHHTVLRTLLAVWWLERLRRLFRWEELPRSDTRNTPVQHSHALPITHMYSLLKSMRLLQRRGSWSVLWTSSPVPAAAAFPWAGPVTKRMTVKTEQTRPIAVSCKPQPEPCCLMSTLSLCFGLTCCYFFSVQISFAPQHSLNVGITAVSPALGCVTAPTTAEMALMRAADAVSHNSCQHGCDWCWRWWLMRDANWAVSVQTE